MHGAAVLPSPPSKTSGKGVAREIGRRRECLSAFADKVRRRRRSVGLFDQPESRLPFGIQPDADHGGVPLPEARQGEAFSVEALNESLCARAGPILIHGSAQGLEPFVLASVFYPSKVGKAVREGTLQSGRRQVEGDAARGGGGVCPTRHCLFQLGRRCP